MLTLSAIALAGGLGAVCRHVSDTLIRPRSSLPLVIMLVNILGSGLAGIIAGYAAGVVSGLLSTTLTLVVSIGFLGGFTTFSTVSVQTAQLLISRRYGAALLVGVVQLGAGVLVAALGLMLGLALGTPLSTG